MENIVYKVGKNEDLDYVSKKFGVPKSAIAPNVFEYGDRVVINIKKTFVYIVLPGDDVFSISKKLNIEESELLEKLQNKPLFVGRHIVISQ